LELETEDNYQLLVHAANKTVQNGTCWNKVRWESA